MTTRGGIRSPNIRNLTLPAGSYLAIDPPAFRGRVNVGSIVFAKLRYRSEFTRYTHSALNTNRSVREGRTIAQNPSLTRRVEIKATTRSMNEGRFVSRSRSGLGCLSLAHAAGWDVSYCHSPVAQQLFF
jgi:hypothetical protein